MVEATITVYYTAIIKIYPEWNVNKDTIKKIIDVFKLKSIQSGM